MKFPSTIDNIKNAANLFQSKFGLPQVIDCVDGTHIPIRQPNRKPTGLFLLQNEI